MLILQQIHKFHYINNTTTNYIILNRLRNYLLLLNKSTNIDVIDSFTNNLIKSNSDKFNSNVKLIKNPSTGGSGAGPKFEVKSPKFSVLHSEAAANCIERVDSINFENLIEIEYRIINLLATNEFVKVFQILEKCVASNKVLSEKLVIDIVNRLTSEENDLYHKKFLSYLNFCIDCDKTRRTAVVGQPEPFHRENSVAYLNFVGKYFWYNGYYKQSLGLLKQSYAQSNACRDNDNLVKIRKTFKDIIRDTVGHKSEAILMYIIELGEDVLDKYNDFYILACIWQLCFRSTWYSDQNISHDLFGKHEVLRGVISMKIKSICYSFLYEHNVETVHRFIELLLKWDMKDECQDVLGILFEYQYWRKDVRACSEIVKSSVDLDVTLPQICYEKLLILIIGKDAKIDHLNLTIPKIKYKF